MCLRTSKTKTATPATQPAQHSKTQKPKFVAKTTTALALRFRLPLQHYHQLQHYHLSSGPLILQPSCATYARTHFRHLETEELAWHLSL